MKIEHGLYTTITAEDGYFLANSDLTLYGEKIILGIYDSPENYTEYPIGEWPETEEDNNEQVDDELNDGLDDDQNTPDVPDEEHVLQEALAAKLMEIDKYDASESVNGFYLQGNRVWLDRETRASLRNTIESALLLNRTTLDIWFGETLITIPINNAKYMLATLEMYATDCYNVTAMHKATVKAFTSVEDILYFDVTYGYPEMPSFNIDQNNN